MSHKLTLNEVIEKSQIVHGNKYDYSKVQYIDTHSKVEIICPKHGIFSQTPSDHYNGGYGCNECGVESVANKKKLQLGEFITKADEVHNNKYDYSHVQYKNNRTKITICCSTHGEFIQLPMAHLRGQGCSKCSKIISRPEKLWLDGLNIIDENRQIKINADGRWATVDAYIPETNTVYEFWGDYWHGNPDKYKSTDMNPTVKITFGELYNKYLDKKKWLLGNGYNLVEIWEHDWKRSQQTQV